MEELPAENIAERFEKAGSKSKVINSPAYDEIKRIYAEFLPDLREGRMSVRNLFLSHISPMLPQDSAITYVNFLNWTKSQSKTIEQITAGKSLMDREMEKTKQQFEIRQDATQMMSTFIKTIKYLAEDADALKKSGIKVLDLYKVIREEEDRSKVLSLRERAENRADAAFAFMVSIARAGQLTDADVEFLEEDTKKELMELKLSHGIYKLPGFATLDEIPDTTEVAFAVASESDPQGSL